MDVGTHLLGEGSIDEALALDEAFPLEAIRDDENAEVSTPGLRARVPGVEMALVDDLDVHGIEKLAKARRDASSAIGRFHEDAWDPHAVAMGTVRTCDAWSGFGTTTRRTPLR